MQCSAVPDRLNEFGLQSAVGSIEDRIELVKQQQYMPTAQLVDLERLETSGFKVHSGLCLPSSI